MLLSSLKVEYRILCTSKQLRHYSMSVYFDVRAVLVYHLTLGKDLKLTNCS